MRTLLTLTLLTVLSVSACAQLSRVTSIFAEPLSREIIGAVKNVDTSSKMQVRQAEDGHLIVIGANTEVVCSPSSFIEMKPVTKIVGFSPVTLAVFEDGQRVQSFGLDQNNVIPIIRIDPPGRNVNRKRVQIALYDAGLHVRTVQQCIVRTRVSVAPPDITVKVDTDSCTIRTGGLVADLVLNGVFVGRTMDGSSPSVIDARHLAPGKYALENYPLSDDVLMPPVKTEFQIEPRYTLSADHDSTPFHYPVGADAIKLQVAIRGNARIARSRVYVNGELVNEYSTPDFLASIPLKDIPTGKTTVDVVGIASDGTHFAPESCPVEIKNDVWESETYSKPEYAKLQSILKQIEEYRVLMKMWYEKLSHEPFSRTSTETTISGFGGFPTFHDTTYSTNALKYKENAEKYLKLLADAWLQAGRIYQKLRMRQHARTAFKNVISYVGEDSADGMQAKIALHDLTIPVD